MKRMIFIEPGRLEWEDVREPSITSDEQAIVKPLVMGRCDLDVLYLSGRMPLASGEPIGHEIIGEIVELGDVAARSFKPGDRVVVSAQISCGECRQCQRGETGRCERVPLGASYGMGREGGFGGAVAERVHVPFAKGMMALLPPVDDLSTLIGLADMAPDAWRAVGPQLQCCPGGTVLVVGAAVPVISLYAVGIAISLGAGRVVYLDESYERRAIASAYGAETASKIEEIEQPVFDIVVDAANDPEKLEFALKACGPAAQLTSVAPPFFSSNLPLMESYYKGLNWTIGRPNCAHAHGPVFGVWSCCGFKPELVGPKLFSFDQAIEAWMDPAPYVAVTNMAGDSKSGL